MTIYNLSQNQNLPIAVNRPAAAIAATTASIFRVNGICEILAIFGVVTTVMEAKAITCKLRHNSDIGAGFDTDFNTALDINAAAVGTILSITGNPADAMIATPFGIITSDSALEKPILVNSGTIDRVAGDTTTGAVKWSILYRPIEAGANIAVI